jgi:hypothetical protein
MIIFIIFNLRSTTISNACYRLFQKDEEWKEYEEIKKDYTGLKIESLKIDVDGANAAGDDDDAELDEDGEKRKKTDGGPWNKIASSAAASASAAAANSDDSRPSTPGAGSTKNLHGGGSPL